MSRLLLRISLHVLFLIVVPASALQAQLRTPAARGLDVDTASFGGDTILLHAHPRNGALAQEFVRYIEAMRPLPGLPSLLPRGAVIRVYLAGNEAAFAGMTGGGAPHWGAGIAQPDSDIIVLPAYSSDRAGVQNLGPIIRHEIAHVALQRSLPGLRIPRWFTEGYAVWSAGQLDPDADWYLRIAFLSDRAPPLDSLELDWPAGEVDARVAYLLSASAVSYLYGLGTEEVFAEFLDRWRTSGSFEQALRATYLLSSTQFEALWSKHVRKRYGWLLFVAQGAVIWALLTVSVIVLVVLRRRRDRRRLEDLRRAEPPDSPAYWLGEELPDEEEQQEDALPQNDPVAPADPDRLTGGASSDKLAP